jgi:hypothetical protein
MEALRSTLPGIGSGYCGDVSAYFGAETIVAFDSQFIKNVKGRSIVFVLSEQHKLAS